MCVKMSASFRPVREWEFVVSTKFFAIRRSKIDRPAEAARNAPASAASFGVRSVAPGRLVESWLWAGRATRAQNATTNAIRGIIDGARRNFRAERSGSGGIRRAEQLGRGGMTNVLSKLSG